MVHIVGVVPKQDHRLEVQLDNRHSVILDMTQKLNTVRFSSLNDNSLFATARLKGGFITWGKDVEMSVSEVLQLLEK